MVNVMGFDPLFLRRLLYTLLVAVMGISAPNLDPISPDSTLFVGSIIIIFVSSLAWQRILEYVLEKYMPKARMITYYLLLAGALCVYAYAFYLLMTITWHIDPEHMKWLFMMRNLFFHMSASFLIGLICFVRSKDRKYPALP